jgi:subtilisin family serine protease
VAAGDAANTAEAFLYARRMGVRVVNNSVNLGAWSQAVEDAIGAAPDTVFTVSAGNEAVDVDAVDWRYPCASRQPNLICVGATDGGDNLAGFSNWGARSVDMAAPGVNVPSLTPLRRTKLQDYFYDPDPAGRWITGGVNDTWARVSDPPYRQTTMADSPSADYQNDTDSWVELRDPIDLSGSSECFADYLLDHSLAGGDVLRFEASDDGLRWTPLHEFAGDATLESRTDDLSALAGKPSVRIRFHLTTDSTGRDDGARIFYLRVYCRHVPYRGDEYASITGTSFAAPHVAGAAALLLAHRPEWTTAQVYDALTRNGKPLPQLAGRTVSGVRLNALWALTGRPLAQASTHVDLEAPAPAAEQRLPQAIADARAPRCRLRAPTRQGARSLAQRGYRLTAVCDESARVSASLVAGRRVIARRSTALRAPGAVRLRLSLDRRATRSLRRHGTAVLRVTATDAAGNARQMERRVRLKRP